MRKFGVPLALALCVGFLGGLTAPQVRERLVASAGDRARASSAGTASSGVPETRDLPPPPVAAPSGATRTTSAGGKKPNIVYFLADNLGFGELGCYGGGALRGTKTPRVDAFAKQGMRLTSFTPESQCTPSRAALMTGRYAIRTGNPSVMPAGAPGGIVAWEKTIADILSPWDYYCHIVGKWHIGETDGRLPTDHGFLTWYGIPRSYGECLFFEDPHYDPRRDPVTHMVESKKGGKLKKLEVMTRAVRREVDVGYMKRAKASMKEAKDAGKPFFMYFCYSMLHLPTDPRQEFKGKTGYGDYADSTLQMDTDFGALLDFLDELGVANDTIVVFSGDNGPESVRPWRGHSGFFRGTYFAGAEGNLRTPCIVRYPGHVPPGRESDEIVHIADMFTTLLKWAGADVPQDREIDGKDQRLFFEGKQEKSAREGFPYWMGSTLYGVRWHHYKGMFYYHEDRSQPVEKFGTLRFINLKTDPEESATNDPRSQWVGHHIARILAEYQASVEREPLIPTGAPLDHVPRGKK